MALAVTLEDSTYDTWGAYRGRPSCSRWSTVCRWVVKRTQEPELLGFFVAAVLKIVVAALSHYVNETFYQGSLDANRYDKAVAALLVGPLRKGDLENLGEISGIVVHRGPHGYSRLTCVGMFLVYSAFGFIGLCLLYVAFCEALPDVIGTLSRYLTPTDVVLAVEHSSFSC